MNKKIVGLLGLYSKWLQAKKTGQCLVVEKTDILFQEIYDTLTTLEKQEYWQEVERLYP
jgi:hypothetical protein